MAVMTAAAAAQMEKRRLPQVLGLRNHTSRDTSASIRQHAAHIEAMMVIQLIGLVLATGIVLGRGGSRKG